MDFSDIINEESPKMPGALPYSAAISEERLDPAEIMKPAANPQEIEDRKGLWAQVHEKLQDPNVRRGLLFAGASMAQPMPMGQNVWGHLANAAVAGRTAFDFGKEQDRTNALADREQGRKEGETRAHVDLSGTQAATNRAALPGVAARAKVEVGTTQAQIDRAIALAKGATTEAQVKEAEAAIAIRRAEIEKSIPDEKIRAAEMAKVDAAALSADEARARLGLAKATKENTEASTAHTRGKTAQEEITTDVLKGMDKQEQKEFLTKTGRYNTHVSSASVTRDMYSHIYDSLKTNAPDDGRIKGKTKDQFVLDAMTQQKDLDVTTALKNYTTAMSAANLDPDPDVLAAMTQQLRTRALAKAGTASTSTKPVAGAAKPPVVWVRDKDGKLVRQSSPQASNAEAE